MLINEATIHACMGLLRDSIIVMLALAIGFSAAHASDLVNEAFSAPTYDARYEVPATIYSSLTGRSIARATPSDHLDERDIVVMGDRVILDVPNAILARFTDTASMDPVLDEKANAIEIVPRDEESVQEGDIIAYQTPEMEFTAIHRVIKRNTDSAGTYYLLQGDNNPAADPYKVRFEDIKSVVVAIVY